MRSLISLKSLIILLLLLTFGYLTYRYFFNDWFLNNQTETIEIENLDVNQVIELKSQAENRMIHSLEIEVIGKSQDNISFYLGESPKTMNQLITIKKGNIDYQAAFDWYSDNAYIIMIATPSNKGKLKIDYRFIGTSN